MKQLILFDIDGTLLHPGNVAMKLLDESVAKFAGRSPQLQVEDVAGLTDPVIIRNALQKINWNNANLNDGVEKVLADYLGRLKREFPDHPAPFVYEDALALVHRCKAEGWHVGLLTGNIREAAKVKLDKFHLWQEFPFGVFGDDATSREDLLWLAQEVAWQELREAYTYKRMVVVGDAPNDARIAQMNNVRCLIVCRRPEWKDKIKHYQPTWLVDSLKDGETIVFWMRRTHV